MACKYCSRDTVASFGAYVTFDTCEYHWLGPEGNLYFTDFEALLESMKEWVAGHPGAKVLPADRFPMLGLVAYVEEGDQEVHQGWCIHLRDLKRWHRERKSNKNIAGLSALQVQGVGGIARVIRDLCSTPQ